MFRRAGRMSRRQPNAGGGSDVDPPFSPIDIPGLVLWLRADLGITYVQGPVVATGTTPPTVTLSGTPTSATNTIEIDITGIGILGVALFSWKWNGVVQQTAQVTAASFPLAGTGITASFGAGTYALNDVYTSVVTVSAWADQSGAGHGFTQAAAAAQPALSTIAGRSSVLFASAKSTYMQMAAPVNLAAPLEVWTMATFGGGAATQIFWSSSGATCRFEYLATTSAALIAGASIAGTGSTPSSLHGYRCVIAGASSVIYQDGASLISGNAGANEYLPDIIGANVGPGNYIDAQIPEVIAYNRQLTASETSGLRNYWISRYGVG